MNYREEIQKRSCFSEDQIHTHDYAKAESQEERYCTCNTSPNELKLFQHNRNISSHLTYNYVQVKPSRECGKQSGPTSHSGHQLHNLRTHI